MTDERPIKTYAVKVEGFPPHLYSARSPGKARAQCWRAYCACADIDFRGFMRISTVRRVDNPPGIGERIMVAGIPATRVVGHSHYTHFMRDDSDQILLAHPSEVEPMPLVTEPKGTPLRPNPNHRSTHDA